MKVFKTLNSPAKNKSRITKIEGFLVSSKREESTKCEQVCEIVTGVEFGNGKNTIRTKKRVFKS